MGLGRKKRLRIAVSPKQFKVAGAFAYQSQIRAHTPGLVFTPAGAGVEKADLDVVLRRDPGNRYDAGAVEVRRGFLTIGHIPKEHLDWAHHELIRAGRSKLVARAFLLRFDDGYEVVIHKNPDGV